MTTPTEQASALLPTKQISLVRVASHERMATPTKQASALSFVVRGSASRRAGTQPARPKAPKSVMLPIGASNL